VEEDVHGSRRFVSASGKGSANTHPQDIRFRAQYDKRVHDALRRFASHPAEKIFEGEEATSVVWAALIAAQERTG
jgi:hypothetical protein